MAYNPDEPRDKEGRWSRIGGAIKNFKEKHGKAIVKVIDKGIGFAVDAKSRDAQASRAVLRKAEALRKKNNDIANQRVRHPRDYPRTAAPEWMAPPVKNTKVIGGAYASDEAWNKLSREIQRAQGLTQVPEERMRQARQQPKVMPEVITVINEAGRVISARMPTPPQKNFVKGPGWEGMGTGLRPASVGGTKTDHVGSVKLDVSKPLTRPEGNLQPYKAAAYNTRAVMPKRTTEYPPTRYTTKTVVRRKLPKE